MFAISRTKLKSPCFVLVFSPSSLWHDCLTLSRRRQSGLMFASICAGGDIHRAEGGLLVFFKWTKTIQCHERRLFLPLVPIEDSPLCPVSLFLRMCKLAPAHAQAPAFTCNQASVTKRQVVSFLRKKLELAGISNPELYRGHSFRRGAASFAFQCGVPGEIIQVFGDWASDAYKVYLETSLSSKLQLAHIIKGNLLKLK